MGGGDSAPTTTVQKNDPPAYLQPYYTQAAQEAQNVYNEGAPAYYPGQTVATPSDATTAALQSIQARATGPQNLQTGAEGVYNATLDPSSLDVGSNPYLTNALKTANNATIQQFNDQVLPGITSTFSQAGRLSSGTVGNVLGDATSALTNSISNSNNQTLYGAYNQAKQDQLATAGAAPALDAAGYAPAQQLAAAGAVEDTNNQNNINADIQKYNYNSNSQKLSLQDYINLLQGTTGNQGVSTSTGTAPNSNGTLGTISGLAGLASAGASLAALSDRRTKMNIRKVGRLSNGLGIYDYSYKWAPQDIQRGVMADEVLQMNPEAVVTGPGGFMMVDYGRL